MTTHIMLAFLTFTFMSTSSHASEPLQPSELDGLWLFEMNHTDIGYARFYLDFSSTDTTFEAHSQKNRTRKILGPFKSGIAKATSKAFKKGAILHLVKGRKEGNKLEAIFRSGLGSFRFRGTIEEKSIIGTLTIREKVYGKMSGKPVDKREALEDYAALVDDALSKTNEYIFNSDKLDAGAYKKFKKNIERFSHDCIDDVEMIFAFFYYKRKLPFSHYFLYRPMIENSDISLADVEQEAEETVITLKNHNDSISVLRIESFAIEPEKLDSIFSEIKEDQPAHLVIDLQDNGGGNIAGLKVITNIIDKEIYGGVFLTNKWFRYHSAPPPVEEFSQFPEISEANLSLLWDGIHNQKGLVIKAEPEATRYKGRVWVLVNGNTASTCEPIVYGLKQYNLATIVGTTTAGSMLNGEQFEIKNNWLITIPTADYYTADGYHIDQKGVDPDVIVKKGDALELTLEMIQN